MVNKIILLTVFSLGLSAAVMAQQTTPADNKWEADIKAFEDVDKQNPPERDAFLFVGSSSIRLWQDLARSFPGKKVINRGFGGSEIADSTLYVDRIVVPYRPRMILLYAGDNDLADNKSPKQVFADYKGFVSRVRQKLPLTPIAFISIKPSLARVALIEKMRAANALIKNYTAHDKTLIYIDVFTRMLGADGKPRPELFGPDGLHMTKTGYELWAGIIAPYLH